MARPISLRLSDALLAQIDDHRSDMSRTDWIRHAISLHLIRTGGPTRPTHTPVTDRADDPRYGQGWEAILGADPEGQGPLNATVRMRVSG